MAICMNGVSRQNSKTSCGKPFMSSINILELIFFLCSISNELCYIIIPSKNLSLSESNYSVVITLRFALVILAFTRFLEPKTTVNQETMNLYGFTILIIFYYYAFYIRSYMDSEQFNTTVINFFFELIIFSA
jgi:hypothetical protein